MRELIMHADAQVDSARLMGVLETFDQVQPLRLAELWAVPNALIVELCAAFSQVSAQVLLSQRERVAAEEWVTMGAKSDAIRSGRHMSTFYEHALQLMHEQEMPASRRMLEEWLERHQAGAETEIQTAHAEQALSRLWLSNVMGTFRMLDALDWLSCFEQLSRVEKELNQDPSGIYPKMDDESKSVLREELAEIARSADLSEIVVARQAVRCAQCEEDIRQNVSWWLYDDQGRCELLRALDLGNVKLKKLVPDPDGGKYLSWITLISLAFFALVLETTRSLPLALVAIPLCWSFSKALINHVCARLVKPRRLLKMKIDQTPDEMRTMVVVPTLISSEQRALEVLSQMEATGFQQQDENIDLLLLGDFKDGPNEQEPGDEALLVAVRNEIKRMNQRAGREKYYYLHRARTYCQVQGNFMGHERKRGALMALNRLLVGGQSEFDAEGACAQRLSRKGYQYVLSLDAGTWMLPGTAHRLIGAIAHPLNRLRDENGIRKGYALLQPRMEQAQMGKLTRFARLMAGLGGVDSYPSCVSEVYQDLCGKGIFGGKGIYDLRAFHDALEGRLPDGAILSHDLLEGLIAGAGTLCDVALYDAFPATPGGYYHRMNRWTRGDWQLIPFLRKPLGLTKLSKYLMIDNLRRTLTPVSALLLILLSMWTGNTAALLVGVIYPFVPALLSLPRIEKSAWVACGLRLSLLPVECYQLLDAMIRTLYRLYGSGKNLLSWVTAADADKNGEDKMLYLPGRVTAVLMLPALLRPDWFLLLLGLGMLFLTTKMQLQEDSDERNLDESQRSLLMDLARDTWRFFETQVPVDGTGLPPDNLQISPPVGAARRTSPSNIGLYLTSCLAAYELEIIEYNQLLSRMDQTITTLESMQTWHGQLYNWYDIDTLAPLTPRYVSAVDGGNLAACLMACAQKLNELNKPKSRALASRMDALCQKMEFETLFDETRKLFVIGADVERDKLSNSHYDLLASESRILSFVAMALGKVPHKHWAHLGRAMSSQHAGQALTSWSGTMFEYLMPELFMRAPEQTLLGATNASVVRAHVQKANGFVWGVSESGYNAFDLMMNYQYRAFGLPQLSLRGEKYEQVIAPYATLLALPIDPIRSIENIRRMKALGFMGEFGLYEAIDCAPERLVQGETHHVVKSFMAHHQGMILCALLNALKDDALIDHFMGRPEVKALSLLLCEKQPRASRARNRREQIARAQTGGRPAASTARRGDPSANIPDTHLLYGGGGTCLTTADGRGFLSVNGIMANRWQLDQASDEDGFFVHVRLIGRGARLVMGGAGTGGIDRRITRKVTFDAGSAGWVAKADQLEMRMNQCVSPEDGALVQQMVLINHSPKPAKLELTSCFKVALCAQVDMKAHPVFQNLFVESAHAGDHALVFRRRARNEKHCPMLAHSVFGIKDEAVSKETDLAQLVGREGSLARPGGIAKKFTQSIGRVLNPCSALRVKLVLEPGEKRELGFAVGIAEDEEMIKRLIKRYATPGAARRAQMLAQTQARAMLSFLNMNPQHHHALQRGAAFLHLPSLRFLQHEPPVGCSISGLWALGVSGDLPIISVFISSKEQIELARDAIRAHEFYRTMGVWCDLLLVNEYGNNYDQPVRDALRESAQSSHLRELVNEAGGVFLLEGASLPDTQRALIRSASSIALIGGEGSLRAQLNHRLTRHEPSTEQRRQFPVEDHPLPPVRLRQHNGWGGFSQDGSKYVIELAPGQATPAPWCNIMANEQFGTLVTERGGGFTWHGNSRFGHLTPFVNDTLKEGFPERLYLLEGERRVSLLPEPSGARSRFRITHSQGLSRFESAANGLRWSVDVFVDAERPLKCMAVSVTNESDEVRVLSIKPEIHWLMGATDNDIRLTSVQDEGGMVFARGAMAGVGFLDHSKEERRIKTGETLNWDVLMGWASDAIEARALVSQWREQGGATARLRDVLCTWDARFTRFQVRLPDLMMSSMLNRWLPYQTLAARVYGRTGLYQAGGAYGFRDQLQDMLSLLVSDPGMVRRHLLMCAGRQFEQGDVMHWWHPERTGVRTRISDDLLFLPYVTRQYVTETGDMSVLSEQVPYLSAEELPEGAHDCYQTPAVSELVEPLHQHCMRAIRRACRFGAHGLPLMGTGDWNDGMDRIGAEGRGESVWLGEFLSVVAREYAELCEGEGREELLSISEQMKQAVEQSGWDGSWYRRAYFDDGTPVGSADNRGAGCRIDAIAQSWAVIAGLDEQRTLLAMDELWRQLVDEGSGIIRLLTPPFDGDAKNPGYIMSYPPGVRENGGQYTHGACWVVMAYALLGQADRAWTAFEMLMPYTHAQTEQDAERYRVEPYVIAADVYSEAKHEGCGGWTWYTGAAAWMCRVAIRYLLGYERRGDRVNMRALLPKKWTEVSAVVQVGGSRYTLISSRRAQGVSLDGRPQQTDDIGLVDDGCEHEVIFPSRLEKFSLQSDE
ncbi:DUF3131 domain-containing protein [Eubacteriales bacterium OttesenSCG-928-N13]|nr:DUF3131 domain-containing protein [Eubacteriales bacterium OttesenSCG-928-N13]